MDSLHYMRDNEANSPPLPDHVESAVQAIAQLHAEHHREASATDHLIDRLTSLVGRPAFLALLPLFVAVWIAVNLCLPLYGLAAFDPPPFGWLVGLLALMSVGMA